MNIIDKAERTRGRAQYHVRLKPGDIGDYVLLPGDPDRVLRIARHLEEAHEIAFHREYRTCTGFYKGIRVSATSTGIGCPSASIAVEELANIGARGFVRVGSTAALQPHLHIGDLLISTGSMRNEGTTGYYVPPAFPAVPDHFLTQSLYDAALSLQPRRNYHVYLGLNASDDAFYGETPEWIQKLASLNLLNVEMESAAIFVVAYLRGLVAGSICAISGNLVTDEVVYEGENKGLAQGWEDAIDVALEAIVRYHSRETAQLE